jgi:chorismate mutase
MNERVSLAHQIAELKREAKIRESVYPQFIARARMTEGEAREHIVRLSAAIRTLEWLQKNEERIRATLEG